MFEMIPFGLQVVRLRSLCQWRREEIMALQERRWRDLLRYASRHSPFYEERLRGIDLRCCQRTDLPPLTKAEMMGHFDAIVTDRRIRRADIEEFIAQPGNLGRAYLNRYAICHTSGSQGQPALVVQKRDDILLGLMAQFARGHELPSFLRWFFSRLRRPVRLVVVTQRPGFYPTGAVFSYVAARKVPVLKLLHLSVFDPIADLVARLNEFQPEFIAAYPSALEILAREQQEARLRLGRELRHLVNVSGPLPETSRAIIEAAFGVHVADHYAMAECMALTSGCPHFTGSHLNADLAILEVVDRQGRPVPDGTPGSKVLITNLYNRIQPLIRYEVGDVVTMSPSSCPCGSPFPLIQSVTGRTEEQFWIEVNGVYQKIPYFVFLAALHHEADLAEHQVVQNGRNHFVVRVAPQPGKRLSAERLDRLIRQSMRTEGLGDILDWEIEVVSEILPDPKSGKMHRVRNLVGPPSAMEKTASRADVAIPA